MFWKATKTLSFTLVITMLTSQAYGQGATVLDGVLTLPEVITADGAVRAEFAILTTQDPVQIELIAYSPIGATGNLLASSFDAGILIVPDASVDGVSYWLEFEHNGGNRFTLRNSGENPEIQPPPLPRTFIPFLDWRRFLDSAYDVGVGANGDVWVIGTDPQPGGYGIYHIHGFGGFAVEGGALRIDVDSFGRPWVVNVNREIYRLESDGHWQRMPGFASDIGIGADGSVWIANFGGVYYWNGLEWINSGGAGRRIDVGPNGQPWVVSFSDRIFTLVRGQWIQLPGEARDIGVGADGSVWVIGAPSDDSFDVDQLQGIYHWNDSKWVQVNGDGLNISVGSDGLPWVTNILGEIWRAL